MMDAANRLVLKRFTNTEIIEQSVKLQLADETLTDIRVRFRPEHPALTGSIILDRDRKQLSVQVDFSKLKQRYFETSAELYLSSRSGAIAVLPVLIEQGVESQK